MKKVSVIGHFGFGKELLNGQTIKTKNVTEELKKTLGNDQVQLIDTHGGIKSYLLLPFKILISLLKSKNVVFFPAHNGVRIISPLLLFENIFFHRKLHYVVIGGWLPSLVSEKKIIRDLLKKLDIIYVETSTMKNALEAQGFKNVVIMPNFKDLSILKVNELNYNYNEPFKVCTFSRVMKEKGIEDAINAVSQINTEMGRSVLQLDIYGQVDSMQLEWFEKLKSTFPEFIYYKGCVDSSKSVEVLKNYYALLFPTHFYTEGIPGTIIDAYAAGVPVISSKWESFSDLITDGNTGLGYEFGNQNELYRILSEVIADPKIIKKFKVNCLIKAQEYVPRKVIKILTDNLS